MEDEPPIAECKLTLPALRAQRDRYRVLGHWAERIERTPGRLHVRFASDVDEPLLAHTLDTERGCCTFLEIAHDHAPHQVTIRVSHPSQDPALDALAFALGDL